jgi:DNA-binding transcriptional regulator YiaG
MIWNRESLRALRREHSLTQADLAHKLGCRQQTVAEWETEISSPSNAYRRLLTYVAENLMRKKNAVCNPTEKPQG